MSKATEELQYNLRNYFWLCYKLKLTKAVRHNETDIGYIVYRCTRK